MNLSKERRQVEIVSLTLGSRNLQSIADLCARFKVEIATINRDLLELRTLGIPIHSIRGRVRLDKRLTEKQIQSLLARFLASAGEAIGYPKNISLTVKKLKEKSIEMIVALVNAITKRHVLKIRYYKMYSGKEVERIIEPYELIPTSREWRLIAASEGYFKQFLVENIRWIETLSRKFVRKEEYDDIEMFRHSFGYWHGSDAFDVTLEFDPSTAEMIGARVWSEDQQLEHRPDGSVVLRMRVNALEQVGDWILELGGHAKVIGPLPLRDYVMDKAKQVLNQYQSG